jgi:soluble lytic murein transglycosylase
MKIYKILIIISLIFFSLEAGALIINEKIYEEYNNIFNNPILSKEDTNNYQIIFKSQENCHWKKANRYILIIDNKLLMGHVLAHRYLHPKCYRSEFMELTYWLKKYNDHPQAKNIYRLAIKRMPKGYKSPNKPIKPIGILKEEFNSYNNKISYKTNKKLSKNQRYEKLELINSIKSRVNKGWPTGAVKLLNQRDVSILLDQVEIDQQKELIAKGYFLANKNKLSIKYSKEALEKSALYVPYAGWTAGLAAWRLEEYKLAAEFFTNFSISLKDDVWHQASGSFWAARSYSKLGNYDDIYFWLNRAAKNPNSFYGLLASNILGITKPIDWQSSIKIDSKRIDIFSLPSGKRVQALIQIGLSSQLENEIIYMNSVLNKDVAISSLNVAQHFNLAYTQLKIVYTLEKYGVSLPTKFFYPTPIWEPLNGFRLEPELIYAFMHQESMFNENAKSHRGAMGLMQVMPSTAKFISTNKLVKNNNSDILKNPEINLDVAQEYIEYLLKLKTVDNNLIYLTAAYNAGPGNLKKWQKKINYLDDPLFFMESIPSRETRWFIEKVLTKYWMYQSKKGLKSRSLALLASGKNPIY